MSHPSAMSGHRRAAPAWARAGSSQPVDPQAAVPAGLEASQAEEAEQDPFAKLRAEVDPPPRGHVPDEPWPQGQPPLPTALSARGNRSGFAFALTGVALLAALLGAALGRWSGAPSVEAARSQESARWQMLQASVNDAAGQGRQTLAQVNGLRDRLDDALGRLDRLERLEADRAKVAALSPPTTSPAEPTVPTAPVLVDQGPPDMPAAPEDVVAPVMVSYGSNLAQGESVAEQIAATLRQADFRVAPPRVAGRVTGSVVHYAFVTDRPRAQAIQAAITPFLPAPPEIEQVEASRDLPRPGAITVILGTLQARAEVVPLR